MSSLTYSQLKLLGGWIHVQNKFGIWISVKKFDGLSVVSAKNKL